jgi:hypothetical protein
MTSLRVRRRPAAWAVVLTVGIVMVAAGLVERPVAQANLARARTDQAAASRDLSATSSELAQIRADIEAITGDRDRDRTAVERATSAAADLADLHAKMWAAQVSLNVTNDQISQQSGQVAALAACVRVLDGVRDHLAAGDPHQAIVALTGGTDACRFAALILGDPAAVNYPFDFADPFIVADGGRYLAFGTNGPAGSLQVLTSDDSVTWRPVGNALAGLPAWAAPGNTWSPAVMRTVTGWVLYYTARDRASGRQCISTATAPAPQGPYIDASASPFICQLDHGGSIDASPFVDAVGTAYLTWKSEDEYRGGRSQIWTQQLAVDGLSLTGAPATILTADQPWEGHIIEGPSMTYADGRYILVYSGNHWSSADYAVGYATCTGPFGPCNKPTNSKLLATTDQAAGPGGAELFRPNTGGLAIAFHAFNPNQTGYPNPRRLHITKLEVAADGTLRIP